MKYLLITLYALTLFSSSAQSSQSIVLSEEDRDAITRVALAEASNQGEGGLSGVVWVILNRYKNGNFGNSITEILNAKNQFEPVTKVKTWKALPTPTKSQLEKINTIINLALSGYFSDPTKGALYFQNPDIVKQREVAGTVSKGLTHFGGSTPTITINDHAFYAENNVIESSTVHEEKPPAKSWDVFNNSTYKINQNSLKAW
jgi:N-acetylmuramoyl-L-alanine amidase